MFGKAINGKMLLQDGQRKRKNKFQYVYKEKKQNRLVRQQCTASARNVAAGASAGEIFQKHFWGVCHQQKLVSENVKNLSNHVKRWSAS